MDHATALKEADAVAAVAREHADETEAGRRLAPAVARAIADSGLTKWWLPTALGGVAGHPTTFVEIIERISRGDASAGWCAGIAIGGNVTTAILPEPQARELCTETRGGAGPFAPAGQLVSSGDGYDLKGRWPFASNCQQAEFGVVGFMRFKDGAPEVGPTGLKTGVAFLRRDQFEIDENWNMAGLRGTGSHDITADTHIDEPYATDLFAPKWPDDALFRLRMFDLLGPSLGVVPLGIGRAALDAAQIHIEQTGGQPQRGPKAPFGVDVMMQSAFGRADMQLRATKAFLVENLAEAYEHAERGDPPPREVSARIGLGVHTCLEAGAQAVQVAAEIIGTAANRERSYLDRLRRDVVAASGHVMFSRGFVPAMGRQMAGMETVLWPFLPGD